MKKTTKRKAVRVKVPRASTIEELIEALFEGDEVCVQDLVDIDCDGRGGGYLNVVSHQTGKVVRTVVLER